MKFFAGLLTLIVALMHFGFMALEMFFWEAPIGLKVFNMTAEMAAISKVLAFNQGFYNGILAVGLLWGLFSSNHGVKVFFLLAITAAGIAGGLTAKISILYIQALPALITLIFVLKTKGRKAGEQRLFS
jgi:putative membrane protein